MFCYLLSLKLLLFFGKHLLVYIFFIPKFSSVFQNNQVENHVTIFSLWYDEFVNSIMLYIVHCLKEVMDVWWLVF
jgi:hypothetical protein